MKTKYPGGSFKGVPHFNSANVKFVEDSNRIQKLTWEQSKVGCYWYSGDFTVSTWVSGQESGYMLTLDREQLGTFPTLDEAMWAAARVAQCRKL